MTQSKDRPRADARGREARRKLVADMSYWETQGMRTDVPFEDSIRKTIEYMSALPDVELINAKHFYWG